MPSNFKFGVRGGEYVKICVHCDKSVSLGASGKAQRDFTLHHVVEHSKGQVFVNQDAK